ncbi:hypothetical protein AGMMS49965_09170 [Bacteroidia bacterium]|nr:hypothetical protein AGMMS49965_09170 [Bacteroidia bacterium]
MKTKKFNSFFGLLLAMGTASAVFTACDDNDPQPTLSVAPATIEATAAAASYPVAVASSDTWVATVSTDSEWCTLDAISTEGLTVNVAANTEGTTRSATVTISSGKLSKQVTVTQAAGEAALSVSPTAIPATAGEAAYSIAVASNGSWKATVSSESEWCTISPATGTGDGTITVNVAKNGAITTRSATITVILGSFPEQVITVTQAATAGEPTLSVSPTAISATAGEATHSIAVASNGTGMWRATVSSGAEWCTISPAMGIGKKTITVNVAENNTINDRSATITVTLGSLLKAITVTQAAGKAALSDITAKVSTGGITVDAVKVSIWDYDGDSKEEIVIAKGKYENGGFTLNLLTPVPAQYLEPLFDETPEGITVSNPKATGFGFSEIAAYNGEDNVGEFRYGYESGDTHIETSFTYVDRDVNVTGSFPNPYGDIIFNCSFKKGWNKMYLIESIKSSTISVEISSTEPSGLKWFFDEWVLDYVSPTRVAKVAKPLFGGVSVWLNP